MLTKDAKKILFVLYKEYLDRRDHGISKSNAKDFDSAESIHNKFFSDWSLEDVEDTLRELGRNEYLKNFYADNTVYQCYLSDTAIAELENRPKEIFLSVTDFIAKFIP